MNRGFSLLELILAIALVTILSTFGFTAYKAMLFRSDADTVLVTAAQAFEQAHSYSVDQFKNDSWSVFIQPQQITIFKGSNYMTRDTNEDITRSFPVSVSVSGTTEINFSLGTRPQTSASATTIQYQNTEHTIDVNVEGRITY